MEKNPLVAVAKFQVTEVHNFGYRDHTGKPTVSKIVVTMAPIYAGKEDPENENWKFAEATPSGQFVMEITNRNLFKAFEVGQVYYLPMVDSDAVNLGDLTERLQWS